MAFEKVSYAGWEQCVRLSNDQIELIATQEVGPRIIRLGFRGEKNVFGEIKADLGKKGGEEWRIYGGHRLWHAPEARPRTYYPDNQPVNVSGEENLLVLVQPEEETTHLEKRMILEMDEQENHVKVTHQIFNRGLWEIEFAAWALSVMCPGGFAIVPQEPFASHQELLTPVRPVVLWGYTNMSDPRFRWGQKYVTLRQDPQATSPNKAGFGNTQGWAAYWVENFVFLKLFSYQEEMIYPDFGSTVEVFTNQDFLELETLSPLRKVSPREAVEHVEHWFLFRMEEPFQDEDSFIDATLLPLVDRAWKKIKA